MAQSPVRFGYGIDLGVKTGATVLVKTRGLDIIEILPVSSWLNGSKLKHTPQETFKFTQQTIVDELLAIKASADGLILVGVDWIEQEVFMGSKINAVRKSAMYGWISHALMSHGGFVVVQLIPAYIRKQLGLKPREGKLAVHLTFQESFLPREFLDLWFSMTEHEKDATIIGYFASLIPITTSQKVM